MRLCSQLMLSAAAAVALIGATASPAGAAPIGFQTDLSDGTHIECAWTKKALNCLDYSRIDAPGRCEAGGEVAGWILKSTGKLRSTYFCVDEGFHDWKVLKAGQTFNRSPFKCRVRSDASALTCVNRTGKVTVAKVDA